MPNWCVNKLTLKHDSPEQLERAALAFSQHRLLSEFKPGPMDLKAADEKRNAFANAEVKSDNLAKYGVESWNDWAKANWGVTSDVGSDACVFIQSDYDFSIGKLDFLFESAWQPPIAAMKHLEADGFNIELFYHEPSMGFCGKYTTETGNSQFDYGNLTAQETKDLLPVEIDELFDITRGLFKYEEYLKNEIDSNN